MTQAELAKASGLSRTYIARLETGHHSPTLVTLRRIAQALRMRVERLT